MKRTHTFTCSLDISKETEGKLRWAEFVDGTTFHLYIPKWRVPRPTPERIAVTIYDASRFDPWGTLSLGESRRLRAEGFAEEEVGRLMSILPAENGDRAAATESIAALVTKYKTHTKTVRYRPEGDPDDWPIGEPYIPFSALPRETPESLLVAVRWNP